ncbi:MAG: SRPBCC domain-containing protein, partial [Myxococcota bacterium]
MSTSKTIALVVLLLGVIVMTLSIFGHKKVHSELVIPASPAEIWAVLTETAAYAEWNPVFVSVTGEHREGAKLSYEMKDQSGKTSTVSATVKKVVPERELNQFGGIPGVVTFDHHWVLEAVEGGTRVTQWEQYRGLYVWFWDPTWFGEQYQKAIEALRDRIARSKSG